MPALLPHRALAAGALGLAMLPLVGCDGEAHQGLSSTSRGEGGSAGVDWGDGGSTSPSCPPRQTLCLDSCVDLETSQQHCGACFYDCGVGRLCVEGRCADECVEGLTVCRGRCVDLTADPANCGSCGFFCGLDSPCQDGLCGCPEGALACDGRCTDPLTSADHCGGCQRTCPEQGQCQAGRCECPAGSELCGGRCQSLLSHQTCGACDSPCSSGEICVAARCTSASSACPADTDWCDGACVDLERSVWHCGSCETACRAGQTCEQGRCACPPGQLLCGETCQDTRTSPLHCGACDAACGARQRCVEGRCTCSNAGDTPCGRLCKNTQTSRKHCGACDNECPPGQPCVDGSCGCPEPLTLCSSATCANLEVDADHCGACDSPCASGRVCVLGVCSKPLDDHCPDTLAHSFNIREVSLYQTGKVSVMRAGVPLAGEARPVDVATGKAALLRVAFDLEPSWQPRVVSLRLLVTTAGEQQVAFDKRLVERASRDAELTSTFNIEVPGAWIGEDTSYAVEVVECTKEQGPLFGARFPEAGLTPLHARSAGSFRVEFIPIIVNDITPDSSNARLENYVEYLQRVYPYSKIDWTVGEPLTANWNLGALGSGWSEVLQQLSNRHRTDGAANNLYYYGVLEPAERFVDYCPDGCVSGIGYITEPGSEHRHLRVAMGVSYGDRLAQQTAAHELGHAHGRAHAPCGASTAIDASYPHPAGSIGWWGLELPDQLYDGSLATDMMGNCPMQWISDYTFQALLERAELMNAALYIRTPEPRGRFRVLVSSNFGTTWADTKATELEPVGSPEVATVHDAQGAPIREVTVYRAPMSLSNAASLMVPEPKPGWAAISLRGIGVIAFSPAN